MLNMRSIESTAKGYMHIRELCELLDELGGVQQMALGPIPAPAEEQAEAWGEYRRAARGLLQSLARDLLDCELRAKL